MREMTSKITRRHFTAGLTTSALAPLSMSLAKPALAQSYPSQDVHLVCAFPPGSGADIIVRFFGERLRLIMKRTIIVDNKSGASGNIATEYIARAKPDGHTMLIHGGTALSANMHLFRHPPVDVVKELMPAATLHRQSTMFVVSADKPWKTVADVTAAMKQKGDKASYAISNTIGKVMGSTYKKLAGLQAVEVSYRSSADTYNDLASGAVDYAFQDNASAIAMASQNRLRILAISTAARAQAAPEYPTMTEAGYPMDMIGWWAAFVPIATPRPVVDQINAMIGEVVGSAEGKAFLATIAADPWTATPDEAQAFLRAQVAQWGEYVRSANIEPLG
jgi:tripartite-type tricarboxylate transporter receptor subunit TctC